MDEVELPEMPELEKEERKDQLNTWVAITVTLLVTFMAMCKITDNNIVLKMEQTQADKVDKWSWYQALNVREDINQSKLTDLKDDLLTEENAERKKAIALKTADYDKLAKNILDKKKDVKSKAEADEQHYDNLNELHEKFDHSEGAISIAVSLLALTSLLQKRWMFVVSLVPGAIGVVVGMMGLIG
jgi:hypothetical protein